MPASDFDEKRETFDFQADRSEEENQQGGAHKGEVSRTERRKETWRQDRLDTYDIFFLLFLYDFSLLWRPEARRC